MFKSISWQEFVIAVSLAAGCYYAFIILIFYRRDITARLKGSSVSTNPSKQPPTEPRPKNLMGAIENSTPIRRKPVAQSSASPEEVEVAETTSPPIVEEAHSPADELLQELSNLFEIMKEGKPSQESYLKNIRTLFSQYTNLIGQEEYTRISLLIIEELKTKHDIFLSAEVMEELWPKETVKHSNHSK
jgi:hypothetical protein